MTGCVASLSPGDDDCPCTTLSQNASSPLGHLVTFLIRAKILLELGWQVDFVSRAEFGGLVLAAWAMSGFGGGV